VTDDLLHHWALHLLDEDSVRYGSERAKLPELRRAQEARLAAERRKSEANAKQSAELLARRRALERDILALEAQEKKYRTQLDAVTDQKQFEAVQHEIAGVAGKRGDLETQVLEILETEETLAAERPALEAALAKAERETRDLLARLDTEDARLATILADLDRRRGEGEKLLAATARTHYQKIRASKGGRAVVAVTNGACGGCARNLTPHAQQDARKRDRLLMCDGCGRWMMLPPDHAGGA
jgi:predicted  nucleic acid-binding Zn-ribbon protein